LELEAGVMVEVVEEEVGSTLGVMGQLQHIHSIVQHNLLLLIRLLDQVRHLDQHKYMENYLF
jgi:hypothetical protein